MDLPTGSGASQIGSRSSPAHVDALCLGLEEMYCVLSNAVPLNSLRLMQTLGSLAMVNVIGLYLLCLAQSLFLVTQRRCGQQDIVHDNGSSSPKRKSIVGLRFRHHPRMGILVGAAGFNFFVQERETEARSLRRRRVSRRDNGISSQPTFLTSELSNGDVSYIRSQENGFASLGISEDAYISGTLRVAFLHSPLDSHLLLQGHAMGVDGKTVSTFPYSAMY